MNPDVLNAMNKEEFSQTVSRRRGVIDFGARACARGKIIIANEGPEGTVTAFEVRKKSR